MISIQRSLRDLDLDLPNLLYSLTTSILSFYCPMYPSIQKFYSLPYFFRVYIILPPSTQTIRPPYPLTILMQIFHITPNNQIPCRFHFVSILLRNNRKYEYTIQKLLNIGLNLKRSNVFKNLALNTFFKFI